MTVAASPIAMRKGYLGTVIGPLARTIGRTEYQNRLTFFACS
jgi:hypothetical protein